MNAVENAKRKSPETLMFQGFSYGADDQIRTGDLILTKDALYRLSYISAFLERENYHTTQALDLQ